MYTRDPELAFTFLFFVGAFLYAGVVIAVTEVITHI